MPEKINVRKKPSTKTTPSGTRVWPMEYRSVAQLEFLYDNPRIISEEEFSKLKDSIKSNPAFFEARPALISNRTGLNVIIAGNQRVKAAIYNGAKQVPTVLLEGLTEAQEREIAIRDNVSSGEWDTEILERSWNDLPLEEWIGVGKEEEEEFTSQSGILKKAELSAVTNTHVLFSFPSEKMAELQPLLQKIADIEGVEYEQTSN